MVEGMATTGIRRKVDDLGRIVIPSTLRKTLGITEGDELEFALDGDRLLLTRPADRCAFCAGDEHLEPFGGKVVCWSCMAAIRALDRERTTSGPFPSR
jgi:AbrB family transcriptional regulator, transcriptional pleiotropic regulator of transition state genes